MTIELRLPNGTTARLADLNLHDLGQYYAHQMDMLGQAEHVLESLGLSGWVDGERVNNTLAIERQTKPAQEFLNAPAPGNILPTYYETNMWQGMVHAGGRVLYPTVDKMTREELIFEIERQLDAITSFVQATSAMVNLAKNIADATQPPTPSMDVA